MSSLPIEKGLIKTGKKQIGPEDERRYLGGEGVSGKWRLKGRKLELTYLELVSLGVGDDDSLL